MVSEIRLRLARHGLRNSSVYHLVAISNKKARNAAPIEKLGEFNPRPRVQSLSELPPAAQVFGRESWVVPKEKRIEWNVDRIKYWISVGATPTKSVVRLLERGGILQHPHKWQHRWTPGRPPIALEGTVKSPSAAAEQTESR
ncbi:ribosomal protein S16 domain-containing protein [Naematelia encephala]|uniref:Ribosomal protein S16 domain-containing protein n=1 Tax=Naematelia encephala TaxID=71784 RepID=A0A1Y2AJ82_9TREE|nr:ribosomal protein S16 domain-containing protein [Naematelia encephala]